MFFDSGSGKLNDQWVRIDAMTVADIPPQWARIELYHHFLRAVQ